MDVKESAQVFSIKHPTEHILHEPFNEGKARISTAWATLISRESTQVKNKKVACIYPDVPLEWCPRLRYVYQVPTYKFLTDSKYTGEWDELGMQGHGTYCLPHNVEYKGGFHDGMFHGSGILRYPMGQTIEGKWKKGVMISGKLKFGDNLPYEDPWKYCKIPDRRYLKSIKDGLRPAGKSLISNDDLPRPIPEGCYDTGDGFYNPKIKCVVSAYDQTKIIRVPTAAEEKWIIANCRKAWDEPTGFRPELFEQWVTGRVPSVASSSDSNNSEVSNSDENNYVTDTAFTDPLGFVEIMASVK